MDEIRLLFTELFSNTYELLNIDLFLGFSSWDMMIGTFFMYFSFIILNFVFGVGGGSGYRSKSTDNAKISKEREGDSK